MFKHVNDNDADDWDVIDLDTNKPLKRVQWANDETGEYCAPEYDKDGACKFCQLCKKYTFITQKGNIKLVKKDDDDE